MPGIDVYTIIIVLCSLIVVSYFFSLISEKSRIPTVLLLLFLGIGIRELAIWQGVYVTVPQSFVEFIGVIGLIIILLEAGLDLEFSRDKLKLIGNAAGSSLFVLVLSMAATGLIVHFWLQQPWLVSLVYAVPLSIISSTIVASSVRSLNEKKREFLTYESSLSDILGILVFNFLIAGSAISAGTVVVRFGSIGLAILVSIALSVALLGLLTKITIDIKIFLLFASLLLVYALGHTFSFPSLLVILIFGLIINNWSKIQVRFTREIFPYTAVKDVTYSLRLVTAESAFLVRTLFFTLFGYTINLHLLGSLKVIAVGTAIVVVLYVVRFMYLQIFSRGHVLPELFYTPRGLVTIVLFYQIPQAMQFKAFDDGILFYVILVTSIVMMLGAMFMTPPEATRQAEGDEGTDSTAEMPPVELIESNI